MDASRRLLDAFGREIKRWLSEADGRLSALAAPFAFESATPGRLDAAAASAAEPAVLRAAAPGEAPGVLPRADDFGHVTSATPPSSSFVRARATAGCTTSTVARDREPAATERHGIFVAAGWGARHSALGT